MQLVTDKERLVCESACLRLDGRNKNPPPLKAEEIKQELARAAAFIGETLSADEEERSMRYLEERYIVSQGEGECGGELQASPIPEWVPSNKPSAEWPFWYRYQRWLKSRVDPTALQNLDEYTDRVLTNLGNPRLQPAPDHPHTWDVRGMVAGHVQSGKTSNYTGLVCKAADAGYKLVVVLTGIHENLRVQTQQRIDDGFIGKKAAGDPKQPQQRTGVGDILVPGLQNQPIAFWGTTQSNGGDFRAANLTGFGVEIRADLPPVVLVVKKNASVLRRLLMWVVGQPVDSLPGQGARYEDKLHPVPHFYRTGCPLLIVDDEADQASVDTAAGAFDDGGSANPDHDPTMINRLVRSILRCFDRSAYVGYTATPFANILIHDGGTTASHGDDLFPRDFIVNLPTSGSYVGPATIFGRRGDMDVDALEQPGLPILLETVTDHVYGPPEGNEDEDWMAFSREGWMPPIHLRDFDVGPLAESLKNAIADWTLAGAGLICRGRGHEHHSMLIHVTRFQDVMNRLHERVGTYWDDWAVRIAQGDPQAMQGLRRRWERSFPAAYEVVKAARPNEEALLTPIRWEDLSTTDATGKTPLQRAVDGVKVLQVHGGEEGQALNYSRGQLKVIAIGGNKLSRGLTLENLTVSYFLRTSKMYDTLMQMGRWFGYRPGFLDLCRLHLAPDLVRWFQYLADATEELREEFDRMSAQGSTPREFGLRVRSHPVMTVTSPVKMREGHRILVSFADTLTQSIIYDVSKTAVESNWLRLRDLVDRLGQPSEIDPVRRRPAGATTYRGLCWNGVPAARVVQFLEGLRTPSTANEAYAPRIAEYITLLSGGSEVTDWTVFLRSNPDDEEPAKLSGDLAVGRSRRGRILQGLKVEDRGKIKGSILATKVLIDSDYESVDIDEQGYVEALELRRAAKDPKADKPSGYIRQVRPNTRGLLLLYAVRPYDPKAKGTSIPQEDILLTPNNPLVGFAVSLPTSESGETVEYIVGNVYLATEQARLMRQQEDNDA